MICDDVDPDDNSIRFTAGKRSSPEWQERVEKSLGAPLVIVSDEEAEKSAFVVCAHDSAPIKFTDDVNTTCADCGVKIRHRPTAPKKPKKICINCALLNIQLHQKENP